MTTVAYRDGIFVSDSFSTNSRQTFDGEVQKLFKTKYWVGGFSGNSFMQEDIIKAFSVKEIKQGALKAGENDSVTILASPADSDIVYMFDQQLRKVPIKEEFAAIGSGGSIACAAMELGASAKEAVRIACKYDIYSGGALKEQKKKVT